MKPPVQPQQNRLIADDDGEAEMPVARTAAEQAAPPAAAAPSRTQAPPEPVAARKGKGPYPGRRQVTAHIDRQLFLWLKSISAQTDKPMVVLFEEALSAYVSSYAAAKSLADRRGNC